MEHGLPGCVGVNRWVDKILETYAFLALTTVTGRDYVIKVLLIVGGGVNMGGDCIIISRLLFAASQNPTICFIFWSSEDHIPPPLPIFYVFCYPY